MTRHPEFWALLTRHMYAIEQTGTAASSQIGGVERGHGSIGGTLRAIYHGANCPLFFWPFAFFEFIRLSNLYPREGETTSKITEVTGITMDARNMVAWGCHVHVEPPQLRLARLMINNRRGVYLGPTAKHKNFWYWPVTTNKPLSARHGVFDEMRYGPGDDSPNTTMLRERLGYLPEKSPRQRQWPQWTQTCEG